MHKFNLFVILSLSMCNGFAHDLNFYSVHPKELQNVLNECPTKHPKDISCEALSNVALNINQLAYELRMDPQAFGQKVLTLQEIISQQTNLTNQTEILADLDKNKLQLKQRLAVIKWLESPAS